MCGSQFTQVEHCNHSLYLRAMRKCLCCSEQSMLGVAEEAVEINNGEKDLTVGYDGTSQNRGFKSNNGFCALTSLDTGNVPDVEIITVEVLQRMREMW